MTVSSTDRTVDHIMDGSITVFSFTFRASIGYPTDITASLVVGDSVTALEYTTGTPGVNQFAVSINSNGVGGTVTVGSARSSSYILRITRSLPFLQLESFSSYGTLSAETLEETFDRLVMMCQQLGDGAEAVVPGDPGTVPPPAEGELPEGTIGQFVIKGVLYWEAKSFDNSTLQVDETNGLQVKDLGITNSKLSQITAENKISGSALYNLSEIPESPTNKIPLANLSEADAGAGGLPTATAGQMAVKGATVWDALDVDGVTLEIDATNGLQVKALGIDSDQIADDSVSERVIRAEAITETKLNAITTAGKVSGSALSYLQSLPAGAGSFPAFNLKNATGGKYDNGIAHGASSPLTFADLNCSTICGASRNLLLLYVYCSGGDPLSVYHYIFKAKGEPDDTTESVLGTKCGAGTSGATIVGGQFAYILVPTDSSGVIQWKCSWSTTTVVRIVSYFPLT